MSSLPVPAPEPPREPEPEAANRDRPPAPPLTLMDRQSYSMLSLVDLSRKLWSTQDVHEAAESLLLNLMGQVGTARAALWLSSDDTQPVLIRCHGMEAALARALGAACWNELSVRFRGGGTPIAPTEIEGGAGQSTRSLARQARVAMFAPLRAEDQPMGLVGLGFPVGRDRYAPAQLEVIEASLAVAGLAMRSARMHGLAMENGRRLQRSNEALQDLDRMKSEFLEHVNHELRTPLAVTLGCLQCLGDPVVTEADRGTLVETATRSTEDMVRLVERVLTLSESSGQSIVVQACEADLRVFMQEYSKERRPGVSAGLRNLVYESDDALRPVCIDPTRLRQVLDELIDNAIKFSAPGTRILLHVCDREEGGAAGARISVRDEGVGIPEERLPDLFQSFHQIDGSRTRRAGGLGIGLAVARQLTEAMGGRIAVERGAPSGMVFAVWVPAA